MMGEAPRSRPLGILTNLVEAETAYGQDEANEGGGGGRH
jgi:hypothetical protein